MNQRIKQTKQKTRAIACDDDVWNACDDIARELNVSMSAYVRSLLEAEIKRRKDRIRIAHAKEVVSLRLEERAGL